MQTAEPSCSRTVSPWGSGRQQGKKPSQLSQSEPPAPKFEPYELACKQKLHRLLWLVNGTVACLAWIWSAPRCSSWTTLCSSSWRPRCCDSGPVLLCGVPRRAPPAGTSSWAPAAAQRCGDCSPGTQRPLALDVASPAEGAARAVPEAGRGEREAAGTYRGALLR